MSEWPQSSVERTERCDGCGVAIPYGEIPYGEEAWADGRFYCADCDNDDWTEATDLCKLGGPAPCIDDICHGIGGCMHYEGGA